jgi:hypothetical protein
MASNRNHQEFAELPIVTTLETQVRQRVIALLELLDKVSEDRRKLEDQEDDILNELTKLQEETNKKGFRHGWLCFTAQKVAARRTLDTMMLIENGCPASIIEQSYKEGKPSVHRKFHRLKEEA